MNKIIKNLILFFFLIIISLIIIISTVGIETNKFNNIISKKINQINNKVNLELNSIKFKLDIKETSLFLETVNSRINYRNISIPTNNIKVYMDFLSLIKSDPKIKKINLVLNQLDIQELKKISVVLKPSNFTSFINNKIKEGKLNIKLEVFLDENNTFNNFIARGSVLNLKTEVINEINLQNTNFSFFADKTDVLIKNISSEAGPVKIIEGDLKLKLSPELSLISNFKSNIKYNLNFKRFESLFRNFEYAKNLVELDANLNNNFLINFDKTYKVKDYHYKSNGTIKTGTLVFKKPLKNYFSEKKINQLSIINSEIKTDLSSKKNTTSISGAYSLNKSSNLLFDLEHLVNNKLLSLKLNAEYDQSIELKYINYIKPKNSIANLSLNFEKKKDIIKIKKLNLKEGENSFLIKDLEFNKNKFKVFEKISVKTFQKKKINNNFSVLFRKKISISGNQFDATNLPKILNQKMSNSQYSHINKEIDIDFKNIITPRSENLKNFKLIGKIEKGKFSKVSAKGDFGNNNYLDIKMYKDKKNKKKYLEIYSDLPKPLLSEFNFFKGLTGGKLLYSSVIDGSDTNSKLKIENFKVINAPGMIKLLSLADLSGLADLAEGEGLSFDILEINMKKNKDFLKIDEILALGPSMSVLMEGYQSPIIISLRGTLVPAKTLNKMISKIPVLGDIIIPKEVGEGLFGISFKMKGPPGDIKTTINPIRTLTPRFIQKIIDKNKNSK
jgi:hypothetical protein